MHGEGGGLLLQRSRVEEGLGTGSLVEVFPDGVVVHGRSQRHENMPDGVGKGDDAIALEEKHADAVDESSIGQLTKTLSVALRNTQRKRIQERLSQR